MNSKWILIGLTLVLLALVIQEAACKSTKKKDSEEEEGSSEKDKKKDKDKDKEEDDDDKKKGSEEKEKSKKSPFKGGKCHGEKIEYPKDWVKAQKKCEGETAKKDDDDDDKKDKDAKTGFTCEGVCMWKELEFFTGKSNKVDSEAIDAFIDKMMTGTMEAARPTVKKDWKECKKEIGDDDEDPKCKKYKKYYNCIFASQKKLCGGGKPAQQQGLLLNLGR